MADDTRPDDEDENIRFISQEAREENEQLRRYMRRLRLYLQGMTTFAVAAIAGLVWFLLIAGTPVSAACPNMEEVEATAPSIIRQAYQNIRLGVATMPSGEIIDCVWAPDEELREVIRARLEERAPRAVIPSPPPLPR